MPVSREQGFKEKSNKLTEGRVVTRQEAVWGEDERGKGVKYIVTEGDETLGGEYTVRHTKKLS